MIYIHYYFADFAKKNEIDIFSEQKTNIYFDEKMIEHKANYEKIKQRMVTGVESEQEALALIEALEHDKILSDSKTLYFQNNFDSSLKTAKEMRDAAAVAETLAGEVQNFLGELKSAINQITSNLNLNLENLKNQIIQEYCDKRNVIAGTSEFRQRVLQDFLTHEGIKKLGISLNGLGTGQAALDSSIRNIILLAEALPEYGENGASSLGSMRYSTSSTSKKGLQYQVTQNGSKTLDIIQGKLQGLLNNVVGTGAEIAWAEAEDMGAVEVAGQIMKVDKAIATGGEMVKVNEDPQLSEDAQKKNQVVRVSKPDVQVTLSRDKVIIDYGVSVKQYKFNSRTNTGIVSIVSNTPLEDALEKYGKQNLYGIYNLAAGHADKKQGYSSDELNQMWDNLVKQVTVANFLDALIGLGDLSVLYLVVNGQVIPVSTILEKITKSDMIGRFTGEKAVSRNAFVRMNQWIQGPEQPKSKELAMQRSNKTVSSVYSRLQQAKLDISIKNLLNMI